MGKLHCKCPIAQLYVIAAVSRVRGKGMRRERGVTRGDVCARCVAHACDAINVHKRINLRANVKCNIRKMLSQTGE